MPWSASDSKRFNKKNTKSAKKRRQFAHVANSILQDWGRRPRYSWSERRRGAEEEA